MIIFLRDIMGCISKFIILIPMSGLGGPISMIRACVSLEYLLTVKEGPTNLDSYASDSGTEECLQDTLLLSHFSPILYRSDR